MISLQQVIDVLRKMSFWQQITLALLFILHLGLITNSRPSQDDYGYLNSLQDSSIFSVVESFWNLWGGNLSTILIASVFIKLALISEIWIAYALFGLFSSCLIGWASLAVLSMMRPSMPDHQRLFSALVVALAGVSSLAFPAHLASLAFVTASIAHLWPICIFLILFWRLQKKSRNVLYLFGFGFLVSNLNIAEGVSIAIVTLIAITFHTTNLGRSSGLSFPRTQNLLPLFLGEIAGILTIVLAPGFSRRVEVLDSGYGTDTDFLQSFWNAFVAFSGVIFTSPMFLALCLYFTWALFSRRIKLKIIRKTFSEMFFIFIFLVSLYAMLIVGSTFAYASWHQSLGLIFLISLASLLFIERIREMVEPISQKYIFVFLIPLLVSLFVYDLVMGISRASNWDLALKQNFCSVKINQLDNLAGAELLNPITGLGFEDIESWDWMRQDYIFWLKNSEEKFTCD
jgi:hypothetical protein